MTESDKNEAIKMLSILDGIPPYDDGANICQGDGYYADSIITRFGMKLAELCKVSGYEKIAKRWSNSRKNFVESLK